MARGQLLTMSSLNGSIGGLTFRDSQNGSIMYGKKNGKASNGNRASTRRMWLSYYASRWRGLTALQRASFNRNSYSGITGFNLFMYCNLNRSVLNLFPVNMQRPVPSFPQFYNLSASIIASGVKVVQFTVSPNPAAGFGVEYQATPPVSPGTKHVRDSLFRITTVRALAGSDPFQITVGYNQFFGNISGMVGERVFVRVRLIHSTTGYASPWLYTSAIVT